MLNFLKSSLNLKLGGIFIIAGTTIGAGMLALPIASSSLNLYVVMLLLAVVWFLMLYSAIILVEVNTSLGKSDGIAKLSKTILGRWAQTASSISIVVLFYSLLTAYLSGSAAAIDKGLMQLFGNYFHIIQDTQSLNLKDHNNFFNSLYEFKPFLISCCVMMLVSLMIWTSSSVVDYSNRLFFSVKLLTLLILVIVLLPHFEYNNLELMLDNESFMNKGLLLALPIFFTSFGFHGSIVYVMKYVKETNPAKVSYVFIFGSLLPLAVYLLWLVTTLGVIPMSSNMSGISTPGSHDLDGFLGTLHGISKSHFFSTIVILFTISAIITSFIGVSAGLYDFFLEIFHYDISSGFERLKALAWTFSVPLILIMMESNLFIKALAFSAIALSVLAVIIPSLVVLKMFRDAKYANAVSKFVFIKKPLIIITMLFGFLMIVVELINLY